MVLGVETCGSLKRWDLFLRELLFYRFYARFSQVGFFLPTLYEYVRSAPAAATDPRRPVERSRPRALRRPRDLDSRIRGGSMLCAKNCTLSRRKLAKAVLTSENMHAARSDGCETVCILCGIDKYRTGFTNSPGCRLRPLWLRAFNGQCAKTCV